MSFSTCCSLVLYVCIHSINCSLPNHQSIIQPPPRSLLFAHPWPQQPLECAAQDPTAAVQRARLLDGCCGQGECTTNKIDCNIVTAPTPFISLLNTRKSVTHSHVHASIHFPTHSPTSTPILSSPQSFQPDLPPEDDFPASWTDPTVRIRTSKSVLLSPGQSKSPRGTTHTPGVFFQVCRLSAATIEFMGRQKQASWQQDTQRVKRRYVCVFLANQVPCLCGSAASKRF